MAYDLLLLYNLCSL